MIDITLTWRPKDVTTKPLLRDGFSQDQLDDIGKVFVHRYNGQTLANAGSMYSKMVRDSGPGFNNSTKLLEPYKLDLSHKSKDGKQRAREAKQPAGVLTKEQAIAAYNKRR